MIASGGGQWSLAPKQVLEDGTGLDVVLLVVDLRGDGQVVKLLLHPEW